MEENITSAKLQSVTGPHKTEWDMRGDLFKGSADGDEHKTLVELDPAPEWLVKALENDETRDLVQQTGAAVIDGAKHILPPDVIHAIGDPNILWRLYDGKEH